MLLEQKELWSVCARAYRENTQRILDCADLLKIPELFLIVSENTPIGHACMRLAFYLASLYRDYIVPKIYYNLLVTPVRKQRMTSLVATLISSLMSEVCLIRQNVNQLST